MSARTVSRRSTASERDARPRSRLMICQDAHLAPGAVTAATRAAGELPGVVVCMPPDNLRRSAALYSELLDAIGKDTEALHDRFSSAQRGLHTRAFYAEAGIRDLIVIVGGVQMQSAWHALVELSALAGCRLWMLVQAIGHKRRFNDVVLPGWAPVHIAPEVFERYWHGRLARQPTARVRELRIRDFPPVPDSDPLLFVSTTERLLDEPDRRTVLDLYAAYRSKTHEYAAAASELTEEQVAEYLRVSLCACESVDEALCAIRGMQAGFLLGGWSVQVNTALFSRARTRPQLPPHPRARTVIGALPDPERAALAAIAVGTDRSAQEIGSLRLRDVTADGQLHVGGRVLMPAQELTGFIRAGRMARLLAGARDDDPMFPGRDGQPIRPRQLRDRLRELSVTTGLPLVPYHSDHLRSNSGDWMRRRGVRITCLR